MLTENSRTVLITGAAGALGQAVVQAFRQEGVTLVLLDRDWVVLESVFGSETSKCRYLPCDLLSGAGVSESVAQALAKLGPLDAVCHLVGGFCMGEAVHQTCAATWTDMMALNAGTFLNVASAVVPGMVERGAGKIVAVGALGTASGQAGMGAYAASKRALQALVESLSAEQRKHGINVNAVLPSIIDTPANRRDMPDADPACWVDPLDLAQVILFLCSGAAKAIHGACVPVRGLS